MPDLSGPDLGPDALMVSSGRLGQARSGQVTREDRVRKTYGAWSQIASYIGPLSENDFLFLNTDISNQNISSNPPVLYEDDHSGICIAF